MTLDPKISLAGIQRIYECFPQAGVRVNRLTGTKQIECLGMIFWVEDYRLTSIQIVYNIKRIKDDGGVSWHLHWSDCSSPVIRLETENYEAYLADMAILRLL